VSMHIYIDTIAHEEQRYPTVGDWWMPLRRDKPEHKQYGMTLEVRVSRMSKEDHEFLVAMHEQIEAYLCYKRGISEEAVTDFDIAFEAVRAPENKDEPGNDPLAPYYKEHQFATKVERILAEELGVNWEEYNAEVNAL